jgi:gamma-glutamyltranspeptidase
VLVPLGATQVPVQDRQPAGSALRPAVMGPSGGVSTGHPLTTAVAFGILLQGGNAFDAGVASLIAGGVLERARRAVLARQDARQPDPAPGPSALHADAQPHLQGRHADAGARQAALERPRAQTAHFYGSFWPHTAGFNQLSVEATIPDAVYDELKARGHQVSRVRPFGMSGCATAVMIDPATGNRFAAADPRRDCYAIAY